jgi:hypothetical protein
MHVYTNMAWPDDPYRTGQQLYPRPAPRLASFATGPPPARGRHAARSAAIVYLPLHRTRTLTVTGQTLTFGFRAASITGEADAGALTALANLDLLQARRHAAVLTGCMLGCELADLQVAAEVTLRGLAAVQAEWSSRHTSARGKAGMFDCPADLPGHPSLDEACRHAHLARSDHQIAGLDEAAAAGLTAAMVVERALVMALICARHLGRYTWDGTLDIQEIMTASTWDCLS